MALTKQTKTVNLLKKKKYKISIAESCTGGMLSSAITSVSGSSKVFALGLVTYSNQSKIKVLKVSKKIIRKYGAVSEQVCEAMLKNLNKNSKTNISVSITGIAGPSGGNRKKPVGLVAYSNQSKTKVLRVSKNIIRKYGSVSKQVCLTMVKNLNKISKTNMSVAITGIAGPSGGTKIKPVGLVYVGIKKNNRAEVIKYLFKNKGRAYIQKAAVNKSLGLILRFLK